MYLYIFEDGSMLQNQQPPTQFDLQAIDDGVLTVISLVGAKFVECDGCGDLTDIPDSVQIELPTTDGKALMTVSERHANAEAHDS